MNNSTKKIIWSTLFLFGLFANALLYAQAKDSNDVRRMFLYHFINYIEWPNEASNKEFKIAVLNDEGMFAVLDKQLNGAKRRGKKIVIERIDETSLIENYQVVYIPRNHSKFLGELQEKASNKHLLFVTDKNGLASKGSGINFKEIGSKLKFEINIEELDKRGLKVASQLKKVGIIM